MPLRLTFYDHDSSLESKGCEMVTVWSDDHRGDGCGDNDMGGAEAEVLVTSASNLLFDQWPRGGTREEYRDKIVSSAPTQELPQSYLLVERSTQTIMGYVECDGRMDRKAAVQLGNTIEFVIY